MTISALVEAIHRSGISPLALAEALNVSPDSVDRWREGRTTPRPAVEGRLRRFAEGRGIAESQVTNGSGVSEARLDAALRELREALHRRGRLSSRNEALDEVARLIFAHSASQRAGGRGIGEHLLEGRRGAATRLRSFVEEMADSLPESLAYEMSRSDFELLLKPGEDDLACEVIAAFERLSAGILPAAEHARDATDLINHAFGRFLADSFADEKELGQYLTPTEVVQFMVQLALDDMTDDELTALADANDFSQFGAVLDPSCGVGSFLAEFVRAAGVGLGLGPEWMTAAARELVVGVDKSERMIRLALANLATFGSSAAKLHLANGLARAGRDGEVATDLDGKVGLILTNPPFGATFSGEDLKGYKLAGDWATRPPAAVDSELLFMERYIEWLRPGGQLLAVVPDSILTNKGLFADLRNGLASDIEIRTVVSLPPVTFAAAGTTTKTSILHLRKVSSGGTPARFAICNDIGYTVSARGAQRKKVRESDGELPAILEELKSGVHRVVHEVSDLDEAGRWDAGYHASLSAEFLKRVSTNSRLLRIKDVAELVADRVDPRRSVHATFEYIEISDVDGGGLSVGSKTVASADAPSRARRSVKAGDVLVSTVRPDRGAVGVVPEWLDGAVCTTGFAVLRPQAIHPVALAALLRTDFVTQQLLRNNVGIAYPAIEAACLPDVVLPLAGDGIEKLTIRAAEYSNAQVAMKQAKDLFLGSIDAAVAEAG